MNKKLILLLPVLLLAGCANLPIGHSAPVHYWRVNAPVQKTTAVAHKSDSAVLLKVHTCDVLQSSRMAYMVSANEMKYAESQRWVEPLDLSASRILREQLQPYYSQVEATPVSVSFIPDHRVTVEIEKAWPDSKGNVLLGARWWISDAQGKILKANQSLLKHSGWHSGDWQGYADNLGSLLAELAKLIDKDLSSLD